MKLQKKEDVYKKLDELNIKYSITNHIPAYTVEDMNNLKLENLDKVIKNLFIRDDKKRNYYLVLIQKDKSINLKELKEKIQSRSLSFASEEDLYKYLGLKKGSVTPLGILNDNTGDIKVIIDNDITKLEFIGIHPNDNTATVWINVSDIEELIKQNGNEIIYVNL